MYLRPRNQIEEFSAFVEFNNEGNSPTVRWRGDVRLSRKIVKLLESDDYKGVSTTIIALTFVKKIQELYEPLTHHYLVAYLQECCFKTCESLYKSLKNSPENPELEQLFLEANNFLLQKDIFDGYDFQSSTIETYITSILRNNLLDIRARTHGDGSRRTDWGLLKFVSQRKINRALDVMGITNTRDRSDYFNLINLFKSVCTSTQGLNERDTAFTSMMEAIADLFNRLCDTGDNQNLMTSEKVIEMLKKCAQAIRQLDSVQIEVLPETNESNVFNTKLSVQKFSSLDRLIELVSNYLDNNLKKDLTNPIHKTMRINDVFILYHGLGYKDAKIGVMYNCNQSTTQRFRSKAYDLIIPELRDWYSTIAVKSFDDPHLIKILSEVLDAIYREKLNEILHMISAETLEPSSLSILSDIYEECESKRGSSSQNLFQRIANKRQVSSVCIEESIKEIRFVLSDSLLNKLKETFDPNFSTDFIRDNVYEVVESWIDAPKR